MTCKFCHQEMEKNNRFCRHCGRKQHQRNVFYLSIGFILVVVAMLFFFLGKHIQIEEASVENENNDANVEQIEKEDASENPEETDEKKRTDLIEKAQPYVYTVYTSTSQGSAFLYNKQGSVVTNAHVVEGNLDVVIVTDDGNEHDGKVIGYSNTTDVAVIDVPTLKNQEPFPLEKTEKNKVGEDSPEE